MDAAAETCQAATSLVPRPTLGFELVMARRLSRGQMGTDTGSGSLALLTRIAAAAVPLGASHIRAAASCGGGVPLDSAECGAQLCRMLEARRAPVRASRDPMGDRGVRDVRCTNRLGVGTVPALSSAGLGSGPRAAECARSSQPFVALQDRPP